MQNFPKILKLSINDKPLSSSKHKKILGVVVDEDMSWKEHINKVLRSANAMLFLLRQIKHCLPLKSRKMFYNAFIMPHLQYCVTIWGKSSDVDRISKFQKRAARVILDKGYNVPSTEPFAALNWMPFKDRVDFKMVCFVYKALNGLAPTYTREMFKYVHEVSNRSTRATASNKLYIDHRLKKKCVRNHVCYSGALLWNNHNANVQNAPSFNAFKANYFKDYYSNRAAN